MSWVTSGERDQAAQDLVLLARSVSDDAERAAWRLLAGGRISGQEIRRVVRTVALQLAGTPTEQAIATVGARSYDPGALDPASELVRAAALHMLGGGGTRGAVLPRADRDAIGGLLRGYRPRTPPRLLREVLAEARS